MDLKRDFYSELVKWKKGKPRQCLLVNGARQFGKTYIIEKFGRENYESCIEINFALEPECTSIFDGSLDVRSIIERLTAIRGNVRIVPGKTLLFLDEIQDCPNARTAFKPFALDGTFDVVASGSLLGIKYKKGRTGKTPRSIPVGFERQLDMHSLSFREYLEAKGHGGEALALVRRCFDRREPVPDPVNARFHALLREYAVVGGMPAVVSAFVESGHYGEVQSLQQGLLADYVADIHKYANTADIPKIENCFHAIPRILAKENRKFKYAEVEDRGTARKYLASVEWLRDARIARLAECVNVALPGLAGYVKEEWFKLYLCDIGLLASTYGMLAKRGILGGTLRGGVKGGIYENLVASILERNGHPIRYYRNDSAEVEFLIENDDGVVPVEVKSTDGRSRSFDALIESDAIPYGIKLTGGNVGTSGKKVTLPHYMAMFL
ncbi:MAG: ATP-binding protein [Kiritimatiellae bacterium]|nr:ATP-binding protein [Kiritimatiellia bacterium]